MWNHIDTPMVYSEKTLKIFKSIDIMALGCLSLFSKEYRKKNPASEWISLYLFPCTKHPTTPASSWMPLSQAASGPSQLCIFFLKLFILLQYLSNWLLHPLCHPSTPLLFPLCREELEFPSLFNTAYKRVMSFLSFLLPSLLSYQ